MKVNLTEEMMIKVRHGCWEIDTNRHSIDHRRHNTKQVNYRVQFKKPSINSAQVLDWIVQIARKGWASEADCAHHFVRALDALLNIQEKLCPSEASRSVRTSRVWRDFEKQLASEMQIN